MRTTRERVAGCVAAVAAVAACGCFPWMFDDEAGDVDSDTDTGWEPISGECADTGYWEGEATVTDATDLERLAGCTYVQGDVYIEGTQGLVDLDGLEWLESIGGALFVDNNAQLASLAGMGSLFMVDGATFINYNDALVSLEGLGGLVAIGDSLFIEGNPSLASLDDLGALRFVEGDVAIRNNPSLPPCAAEELVARLVAHGFDGTALLEGNGGGECEGADAGL